MIRRNVGTVLVATALVLLLLIALGIARTIDHLPELAIYITEDLFGIVLAVFVLERVTSLLTDLLVRRRILRSPLHGLAPKTLSSQIQLPPSAGY